MLCNCKIVIACRVRLWIPNNLLRFFSFTEANSVRLFTLCGQLLLGVRTFNQLHAPLIFLSCLSIFQSNCLAHPLQNCSITRGLATAGLRCSLYHCTSTLLFPLLRMFARTSIGFNFISTDAKFLLILFQLERGCSPFIRSAVPPGLYKVLVHLHQPHDAWCLPSSLRSRSLSQPLPVMPSPMPAPLPCASWRKPTFGTAACLHLSIFAAVHVAF